MRLFLLIAFLTAATSARAAELYRLLSTTAAVKPNASVYLLTWNAVPAAFEIVYYSVYQADTVDGPYTLIGNTDTNEFLLVGEHGTHFWHVRSTSIWNERTQLSEPSLRAGLIDTNSGGLNAQKVPPRKPKENALPETLLVPLAPSLPLAVPFRRDRAFQPAPLLQPLTPQ